MSHFQNEIDALNAEIAQISSSKKIVARTTLQILRDLFNTSTNIGTSPLVILRRFIARHNNVEMLEKVSDPILMICRSAPFFRNLLE